MKKRKKYQKLVSGRLLYNSSTTNNRDLHHEAAHKIFYTHKIQMDRLKDRQSSMVHGKQTDRHYQYFKSGSYIYNIYIRI